MRFVRYQSPTANSRGVHPGIFALTNSLDLCGDAALFRRTWNDWYHAHVPDPTMTDPTVYDRELNPGAVAWFRLSSTHLFEPITCYLAMLADHGVVCVRVESDDPGRVVYEDADQVVVVPH